MEKTKWPWKRRSSESESSSSFSSHSAKYSDEQDATRESQSESTLSPEVTSKAAATDDAVSESMRSLTEKLSAALVNVSAKEDLVKQHAKVAEDAVAGWEKAEREALMSKQQLEVTMQQKTNLEVRISHLDGALKECVRQLRQARDEQAMKDKEWELTMAELKEQIRELQGHLDAARTESSASVDPKSTPVLDMLEKENVFLKQELASRSKELEIVMIERDLSTQAAETASKLQLESIKKVATLEAECRKLQSVARKSYPVNSVKPTFPYPESFRDSHSDGGDRLNLPDIDAGSTRASELSCSDMWASALIAELDQFKKDKPLPKSSAPHSFEIDMMDDFLEMERLAALPETKSDSPFMVPAESISMDNPLKLELESWIRRVAELEKKLDKTEDEKSELEAALYETQGSLKEAQRQIAEVEAKLDELQKELNTANEAKELLESQLIRVEAETRTMTANVDSSKAEIESERILSAELRARCREMENELTRKALETEPNSEPKIKQEDLAVAANKLVECQKTIASLGRQLKSLATLEDFLIDTANIPGINKPQFASSNNGEMSKVFNNMDNARPSWDNGSPPENGNLEKSPPLSSSSLMCSTSPAMAAAKSRNGFGQIF